MANYFVVKHSTTNLAALEALGISPSTLKVEVWGGSKNRGFKPESYRLDIEREPEFAVALAQVLAEKKAQRSATAKRVAAEVAEDKAAGIESKAARLRREKAEWDMEAESMGLLPDSRTFASFIHVVCQNTFNLAMQGSRGVISIRHTSQMRQKLEMAAMVLLRYRDHFDLTTDQFSKLASVRVDDAWLDEYLRRMIGDPDQVPDGRSRTLMQNRIRLIEGRLAFGKGVDLPGVSGSAWWALNAMVEYADFDMKAKGQAMDESRRTNSILFGTAADFKQEAFDTAMAMATR